MNWANTANFITIRKEGQSWRVIQFNSLAFNNIFEQPKKGKPSKILEVFFLPEW